MEIDTPDLTDGSAVMVQVQHAGDTKFGSHGITMDPDASCSDGLSSDENASATVQDGKVVFYTCGASTFVVTYTGSVTTSACSTDPNCADNLTRTFT
jgi:hypothetical protein